MKDHLVKHPSVVLIIGRRRFGKSALGNYILETFHNERHIPAFIVSFPKEKRLLLPDWITPVETFDEVPENSVCLIDEGSLKHHAHLWNQKETVVMDRMISVSGQKKQTIIFITHTMRKFAVTLLLEVDLLLCKQPSLLHSKLERSEVRKLTQEIYAEFRKLPKDQIKKSYYVISDEFQGFLRNPLPSYWSEDLSEAYAGIDISEKEEIEQAEVKHYPLRLQLKIWFKPEEKDNILDVILCEGERLDEMGVVCTADKCHLDFDLKHVGNGKYTLVSKRFNLEENLKELHDKKISFYLDTETSMIDGEFYPISEEQLVFNVEKPIKEKDDILEKFADKMEL